MIGRGKWVGQGINGRERGRINIDFKPGAREMGIWISNWCRILAAHNHQPPNTHKQTPVRVPIIKDHSKCAAE